MSSKLCGAEQRAPPIFGRAAITLGIGPHSSLMMICSWTFSHQTKPVDHCPLTILSVGEPLCLQAFPHTIPSYTAWWQRQCSVGKLVQPEQAEVKLKLTPLRHPTIASLCCCISTSSSSSSVLALLQYRHLANTTEKNSSDSSESKCTSCHQQGHAGSKTLLQ